MIFGNIKALDDKTAYPAKIWEALEYLRDNDMNAVEAGKIVLEGDKMFINVVDTETEQRETRKAETHNNYLDIQFLARGEESIGFAIDNGASKAAGEYDEKKDITFFTEVAGEMYLDMKAGDFAVFFPRDIHRPKCATKENVPVRKVIVKIHMDLLK